MTVRSLLLLAGLIVACSDHPLLGPLPPDEPHLTVLIDGQPFVAYLGGTNCLGVQTSPSSFFLDVHSGFNLTPSLALYLGNVSGPGPYPIRPDAPGKPGNAANYLVSIVPELQYSAGSGLIQIDEYDTATRAVAGRFYLNAQRAVGTGGPVSLQFRDGSFRGVLLPWPPGSCL